MTLPLNYALTYDCAPLADLDSLPHILQKKYSLLRDLDKSLQGKCNKLD